MEKIRILLLSDIHIPQKVDYISALKRWHQEVNNGYNYDFLFVSGDIANLDEKKPFDADENLECESQI